MPIGPGAPLLPPAPRKKSAAPWIAVAAVVVLGAATALIIVLTNRDSGNTADPGPTGGGTETVGAADPGIREYPSFEVSIDPAEEQARQQTQQQAQQVADSWVQALNIPDIDTAVGFMCQANQSVTESQLLAGIEPGSLATGTVVIQGKRARMPLTFRETSGEEVDSALPMRLEDDAWKVCL